LTYQCIHSVEDLVAQAGLSDGTRARGNHERPQYRCSDQANRAHGGLVNPFLLADHRHDAASGALKNQAQGRLQADQRLQVAAFLQLHHYLAPVAELLYLVVLYAVDILKIISEPVDIYFFAIVKPGIHSSHSFKLICLLYDTFFMPSYG
jgi:hypothetical protein